MIAEAAGRRLREDESSVFFFGAKIERQARGWQASPSLTARPTRGMAASAVGKGANSPAPCPGLADSGRTEGEVLSPFSSLKSATRATMWGAMSVARGVCIAAPQAAASRRRGEQAGCAASPSPHASAAPPPRGAVSVRASARDVGVQRLRGARRCRRGRETLVSRIAFASSAELASTPSGGGEELRVPEQKGGKFRDIGKRLSVARASHLPIRNVQGVTRIAGCPLISQPTPQRYRLARAVVVGAICGIAVFQGGVVFSLLISALSYQARTHAAPRHPQSPEQDLESSISRFAAPILAWSGRRGTHLSEIADYAQKASILTRPPICYRRAPSNILA